MPSAEVLTGFLRAHGLQLNAQQQAAAGAVEGPVLLLAVPGSGKTTVLVTRLGYLVQCCNVRPEEILTMTYTVAATRDMRSRFSSLFGEELGSRMEFRTINGVSARIIRAYEQRMGRTAFSLLSSEAEQTALLRQPKSEARGLILSTVHSSKGLEYDRVFLLDVIDGVFPKEGEDVDRDEERRLFYVAMTRARNELAVFTFPPEKTSSAFSQFLFRPKRRIPRKSKKKTAADSFLPGTPVQHSAYGAGRILAREGDRVRIRFSSGSERVFSLAAAVPNGLLSLRQESGGNAAKAD